MYKDSVKKKDNYGVQIFQACETFLGVYQGKIIFLQIHLSQQKIFL